MRLVVIATAIQICNSMRILLIAFMALFGTACAAGAAPLAEPQQVDIPLGDGLLHAQLSKPEGAGPFAVVIALHGCDGLAGRSDPGPPRYRARGEPLVSAG